TAATPDGTRPLWAVTKPCFPLFNLRTKVIGLWMETVMDSIVDTVPLALRQLHRDAELESTTAIWRRSTRMPSIFRRHSAGRRPSATSLSATLNTRAPGTSTTAARTAAQPLGVLP